MVADAPEEKVTKIGAKIVPHVQPTYDFPRNVPPAIVRAIPEFLW
jgi:hypothetical protein